MSSGPSSGPFTFPASRPSQNAFNFNASNKELEIKRKTDEIIQAKDEMIAFLLPPKSAKNDYLEQKPAKYVFQCLDGDIQIPEYGILRTEFYYQVRVIYIIYKTSFICNIRCLASEGTRSSREWQRLQLQAVFKIKR